jgi:acetoin utilization deacetylase AcuC-like enzyme
MLGGDAEVNMSTGFVWHERYMWHDTGSLAGILPPGEGVQPDRTFEHPDTKRRMRNLIEVSGLLEVLTPIAPRLASEEELLRFHTPEYLARIRKLSEERGGDAGEATPFGPGSYDIARLAAGGAIEALDAVVDGRVQNAYALVRPPGHHAEPDRGRGFCIFGNVALAVMHARAVRDIERVAIVDWDVHHGNGTQAAFYDNPEVLTISIHQDRNYPLETGSLDERGAGAGEGYNLNVPLPPGSGHGAYVATIERVVEPALRAFQPELIVVPSGFDASSTDPLGRMLCSSETYREMTRRLMQIASEVCRGRLLLCHEGGYSNMSVPPCGLAVLEQLSGHRTGVQDSAALLVQVMGGYALEPHQEAVIERAAALAPLAVR